MLDFSAQLTLCDLKFDGRERVTTHQVFLLSSL